MQEEIIKDFYHRIIGYVQTDNQGNKKAFDFYRRLLGTYNKQQNVTKDFYNRIVARGDAVVSLIYTKEAKRNTQRKR